MPLKCNCARSLSISSRTRLFPSKLEEVPGHPFQDESFQAGKIKEAVDIMF